MTLAMAADSPPLSTDADGVVRVGATRVSLDTLIAAFLEGAILLLCSVRSKALASPPKPSPAARPQQGYG